MVAAVLGALHGVWVCCMAWCVPDVVPDAVPDRMLNLYALCGVLHGALHRDDERQKHLLRLG